MKKKIFFTYDPVMPYFTFPFHIRQSSKSVYLSPVPAETLVKEISEGFIRQLDRLLSIPEHFKAVLFNSQLEFYSFLSSVFYSSGSLHPIHGDRGKDWSGLLRQWNFHPVDTPVNLEQKSERPKYSKPDLPVHIFLNEPGSGSCLTADYVDQMSWYAEGAFIHGDLTDCVPGTVSHLDKFTSFSFGFSSSFGLPFNKVIWFVNDRIFEDFLIAFKGRLPANQIHHLSPGFYCFGAYDLLFMDVSAKVFTDMHSRGLKNIINETKYKAAIIEQAVSGNPVFLPAVKDPMYRSMTTIVLKYQGVSEDIVSQFGRHGIVTDKLATGGSQQKLRITNFPVHSKEQFEMMADLIQNAN